MMSCCQIMLLRSYCHLYNLIGHTMLEPTRLRNSQLIALKGSLFHHLKFSRIAPFFGRNITSDSSWIRIWLDQYLCIDGNLKGRSLWGMITLYSFFNPLALMTVKGSFRLNQSLSIISCLLLRNDPSLLALLANKSSLFLFGSNSQKLHWCFNWLVLIG